MRRALTTLPLAAIPLACSGGASLSELRGLEVFLFTPLSSPEVALVLEHLGRAAEDRCVELAEPTATMNGAEPARFESGEWDRELELAAFDGGKTHVEGSCKMPKIAWPLPGDNAPLEFVVSDESAQITATFDPPNLPRTFDVAPGSRREVRPGDEVRLVYSPPGDIFENFEVRTEHGTGLEPASLHFADGILEFRMGSSDAVGGASQMHFLFQRFARVHACEGATACVAPVSNVPPSTQLVFTP